MGLGKSSGGATGQTYDRKLALSFRRAPAGEKPFFTVREYFPNKEEQEPTDKVSGIFKGVIYNEEKDITSKDGKALTIPAKYSIVLEDNVAGESYVYYVEISTECGSQLRPVLNSLLGVNVGEPVELATYNSKGKDGKYYKVINVSNPEKQKEIEWTNQKGEKKKALVNEGYPWVFSSKELPEIEIIKNKAGEVKSVDDSEQMFFLREKIAEKFDKTEEKELTRDEIPF